MLRQTFHPNRVGDDLTPEPRFKGFRRAPQPLIHSNLSNPQADLVLWWESIIVQLDEAWLYDGTPESAEAFKTKTTLTPAEFAQSSLECEGSLWCYFKPTGTGQAVAEAMVAFWAERMKAWKAAGGIQAAAAVVKTSDGGNVAMAKTGGLIEETLQHLVRRGGINRRFAS